MPKTGKSSQSYSNGNLPYMYHCSFCYLAHSLVNDAVCKFACAEKMCRNTNVLKLNNYS